MGKYLKLSTAMLSFMILAACGDDEANDSSNNEEINPTDISSESTTATEETEVEAPSSSSEVLNPNIAELTEGNVEVIYTNESPNYAHDMNGFKVFVNAYEIAKVTDMNGDFYIEFDDQTEGYIITAKITIDNTTDKAMYYTPNLLIQLANEYDYYQSGRTFVRDEYPKSGIETEVSKWAAGEKVTGLVTFTLTNDEFDALDAVKPKFVIEGGVADNSDFSGLYREDAIFDFTYNEDQAQAVANAHVFYPDRLTTGNMADKVLIFEDTAINETKQLADIKVTLEGIQYTETIPTPGNEERFRNFGDNGVVALTAKFILDNQSSEDINLLNISSKVTIDQNRGNVFAQGMIEPSAPDKIKAGEQGEKYHVFLFRKDEFEIFKMFDLEFGPFTKDDGSKQFKGETVTFTLPR